MKRVVLMMAILNLFGGFGQVIDDFNSVKDHVTSNGEDLSQKKSNGKWTVSSFELITEYRRLTYVDFGNQEQIKITRRSKREKLPKYLMIKMNDTLTFSAYYSRFDTEEDVLNRKKDWAELVKEVQFPNIPFRLRENLELGNYHWKRKEMVKAQKAYQKFVELMKFEGLNEQIPEQVRERLFKCRYAKINPKD